MQTECHSCDLDASLEHALASVFSHRFVLTDADHYVLEYLESMADQIPRHTLESLRNRLGVHSEQREASNQPQEEETGGSQQASKNKTNDCLQVFWGHKNVQSRPQSCKHSNGVSINS